MTTTIVYTITFLILCFVLYIAFKSINIGLDAKRKNKENLDDNGDFKLENDLIEQIDKLKRMRDDGAADHQVVSQFHRRGESKLRLCR